MPKARQQGRKPIKPGKVQPRQSATGTGGDNRTPPKAKNPPATGQKWSGHLQNNPPTSGI